MNDPLFEVVTPLGYIAVLGRQNWGRHEAKRPELRGQAGNVENTCREPFRVIRTADGCEHFYAKGYGIGSLSEHYPHVLVRAFPRPPDDDEHVVVSGWFTKLLKAGTQVWPTEN